MSAHLCPDCSHRVAIHRSSRLWGDGSGIKGCSAWLYGSSRWCPCMRTPESIKEATDGSRR